MAEANARFMKRKVKAGAIEVDIETCTLIVNYEVEATVLGDMGEPIVADRKSNQKLIRLKTLNENTDVPRLVDQILEQCKLIHESKRPLVEGLLRDLQRHQQHGAAPRAARRAAAEPHAEPQAPAERASLAQLPAYIDQCYEGVEAAVHATGLLLQLAREPPALEPLVQDERLLGCLVRLLVDEGKKSADLALNIVSVLYALSQYSDFHAQLLAAKVGSLVMDVVDLEIKRHELRRRERAAAAAAGSEAEEARERLRQRKSETLLYVCFHLLLNLSEDINTERKMAAHGLVPMLTAMLARQNADLLVLVLAFLKKLSIFGENASEMGRARLADKLVAFVPNQHDEVLEAVLRLLSNLAFQPKCRAQMAKAGLAPKLLSLLRKGRHRLLAVRLLYQLSHLDSERAKMTASVPMLVGTVINTPDVALVPAEVFGLVVNLMTHTDNARACAKARGALRGLVTLAVRAQHTLALKALRNMTQAAGEDHAEELARTYSADLLELAAGAHSADVQVEALGLLANLPLGSVDELAEQLAHSGALELIHELLVAGMVEDDATLEAVRFVGALAEHGGCAALLARSGRLLAQLLDCFDSHQDDDEIVLAVVHACYRLLFNEVRRARRTDGRTPSPGSRLPNAPGSAPMRAARSAPDASPGLTAPGLALRSAERPIPTSYARRLTRARPRPRRDRTDPPGQRSPAASARCRSARCPRRRRRASGCCPNRSSSRTSSSSSSTSACRFAPSAPLRSISSPSTTRAATGCVRSARPSLKRTTPSGWRPSRRTTSSGTRRRSRSTRHSARWTCTTWTSSTTTAPTAPTRPTARTRRPAVTDTMTGTATGTASSMASTRTRRARSRARPARTARSPKKPTWAWAATSTASLTRRTPTSTTRRTRSTKATNEQLA